MQEQSKQKIEKDSSSDIYSQENLFTGEVQEEPKKEFENFYKVMIQAIVKSFKVHEDGSLQLKFIHKIPKSIGGIEYIDYEDKSIRVRKEKGAYSDKEAQNFLNKCVEIRNVKEMPVYVKKPDDSYDFSKVERYLYSADNIKVIENKPSEEYELFKIIEINVLDAIPSVKYDVRKRVQVIDKEKSVLIYEVRQDSLISLHKIIVNNLSFNQAKELKGKDIVILDFNQVGKNYYCTKIKLK
jgi:hypothetical protein